MEVLNVVDLEYSYSEEMLYKKSSFKLMDDDHMAVVGPNGSGKSTLLKLLLADIMPDKGEIKWHKQTKVGYIDQFVTIDENCTVEDYLLEAYKDLFALESKMTKLYSEFADSGEEKLLNQAAEIQSQLESRDFYTIQQFTNLIVQGLGLDHIYMGGKMIALGQGQRLKIMLAKLLLEKPTVMILDEPTNYLDKENTEWLANYLQKFNGAFIVVSHDFSFVKKIANCICDVDFKKIEKYHMGYEEYLKLKKLKVETHQNDYVAQQRKIKETEEFIRRNIAGIHTKMAQGRRKHLEKIERIEELKSTPIASIKFKYTPTSSTELIKTNDLSVGYTEPLIKNINMVLKKGKKLVFTGEESSGKTTLVKTLLSEYPQISGQVHFSPNTHINYFSQELYWENERITPIDYLAETHVTLTYEIIRRELAKCGLPEELASREIATLSGGEQTKIKICDLTLTGCNVLILDDPTKHLDEKSKTSLALAIKEFNGSAIVISDDSHFYETFCDEVYRIKDNQLISTVKF